MGEPKEDFENELDGANEYPLVLWGPPLRWNSPEDAEAYDGL
jgi:hypothetical protein